MFGKCINISIHLSNIYLAQNDKYLAIILNPCMFDKHLRILAMEYVVHCCLV